MTGKDTEGETAVDDTRGEFAGEDTGGEMTGDDTGGELIRDETEGEMAGDRSSDGSKDGRWSVRSASSTSSEDVSKGKCSGRLSGISALWDCVPRVCGGWGGCASGGVPLGAVAALSWCGEVSLGGIHIIICRWDAPAAPTEESPGRPENTVPVSVTTMLKPWPQATPTTRSCEGASTHFGDAWHSVCASSSRPNAPREGEATSKSGVGGAGGAVAALSWCGEVSLGGKHIIICWWDAPAAPNEVAGQPERAQGRRGTIEVRRRQRERR